MLKALIKKQLMEIFRSYFFDYKKSKARSKAGTIAFFILFVFLTAGVIGGMLTGLAILTCYTLCGAGYTWFYFLIFAGIAMILGLFGTVFNTFTGLYKPRDNDLLLSCPVPVNAILFSRLLPVFLLDLVYTGIVMVPGLIVYWILMPQTALTVIGSFLFWVVIALIVFVLSCLFGWVVAQISKKLKNKSIVTVLIAVVALVLYYVVYFKATYMVNDILANVSLYGEALKNAAYPLYLFARMSEGNMLALAISLAVTLALTALVWVVQSKSFIAIATASESGTTNKKAAAGYKQRSVYGAMLRREMKRFTSSANYMLNAGLGVLMIPAYGIFMLVMGGDRFAGLDATTGLTISPVLAFAAMGVLASMNDMAAPSVSLEGKNLWLTRSLPVSTRTVLCAKGTVQLLLSGVPMLFAAVCTAVGMHTPFVQAVVLVITAVLFTILMTAVDLWAGIRFANVNWTNEIVPVKQGAPVFIGIFGAWIVDVVCAGAVFGLSLLLPMSVAMSIVALLMAGFAVLLVRWVSTKGVKAFEAL